MDNINNTDDTIRENNLDNIDRNEKPTRYYSNGRFSDSNAGDDINYSPKANTYTQPPRKKGLPSWAKALIVIGSILLFFGLMGVACDGMLSADTGNEVVTNFGYDYIGVVYVDDTIDEYGSGTYNHQYILNAIDAMAEDSHNKGMILYVDTPGGSVFASDELYLKIKEYQQTTERPVYSSMQGTAASGGYYISAPCEKIIANRNCWTGSIGVTMGTFVDVSGLLEKLGVKTQTITAGSNKAMGSSTEPLTAEQRAIYQSLVDEAYEQFVAIVAEGRDMPVDRVKTLADGRIYTANQALQNGLVDMVGTFDEAVADMQKTYKLEDCAVEYFQAEVTTDFYDLLGVVAKDGDVSAITDADAIEALIELNGTYRVSYMSDIKK